jgi:hypothetical protein
MACNRITSGGRTWIQHDNRCPGRFNLLLCLFWLAEEELRGKKDHEHHPYDNDNDQDDRFDCDCENPMCRRRHPHRRGHHRRGR